MNLLRLGRITGDPDLEEKADKITRAFSGNIRQLPSAYTQMLCALEFALGPSYEVTIAGFSDADDTGEMLRSLRRHSCRTRLCCSGRNRMNHRESRGSLSSQETRAPWTAKRQHTSV